MAHRQPPAYHPPPLPPPPRQPSHGGSHALRSSAPPFIPSLAPPSRPYAGHAAPYRHPSPSPAPSTSSSSTQRPSLRDRHAAAAAAFKRPSRDWSGSSNAAASVNNAVAGGPRSNKRRSTSKDTRQTLDVTPDDALATASPSSQPFTPPTSNPPIIVHPPVEPFNLQRLPPAIQTLINDQNTLATDLTTRYVQRCQKQRRDERETILAMTFDHDGNMLVAGTNTGRLIVYDLHARSTKLRTVSDSPVYAVQYVLDNTEKSIYIGLGSGWVERYSVHSLTTDDGLSPSDRAAVPGGSAVNAIAYASRSDVIWCVLGDGQLFAVRARSCKPFAAEHIAIHALYTVIIVSGDVVAAAGNSSLIYLHAETDKKLRTFDIATKTANNDVQFPPAAHTGTTINALHDLHITSIVSDTSCTWLYAADSSHNMTVWHISSGLCLRTVPLYAMPLCMTIDVVPQLGLSSERVVVGGRTDKLLHIDTQTQQLDNKAIHADDTETLPPAPNRIMSRHAAVHAVASYTAIDTLGATSHRLAAAGRGLNVELFDHPFLSSSLDYLVRPAST